MNGLKLRRIWEDQDLVELACDVDAGTFRGTGTCYVSHDDIPKFATDIEQFIERLEGRVSFTTGLENGTKAVHIDLYTIDMARHTVIQVRIATEPSRHQGPISRLELELPVEPAALQEFASALHRLCTLGDEALLRTGEARC